MQKCERKCWLIRYDSFAKCRIKGPKAEEFLDNLVANKLPKK